MLSKDKGSVVNIRPKCFNIRTLVKQMIDGFGLRQTKAARIHIKFKPTV